MLANASVFCSISVHVQLCLLEHGPLTSLSQLDTVSFAEGKWGGAQLARRPCGATPEGAPCSWRFCSGKRARESVLDIVQCYRGATIVDCLKQKE